MLVLESLVRALVSTWTERGDAFVKHDSVVAVFTTANATGSRGWTNTVANHRAGLYPALALHKNIY